MGKREGERCGGREGERCGGREGERCGGREGESKGWRERRGRGVEGEKGEGCGGEKGRGVEGVKGRGVRERRGGCEGEKRGVKREKGKGWKERRGNLSPVCSVSLFVRTSILQDFDAMTEDQQMAFAIQMSLGTQQGVDIHVQFLHIRIVHVCTYLRIRTCMRVWICSSVVVLYRVCRYPKV